MSTDQESKNNQTENDTETKKVPEITQTKAKQDPVRSSADAYVIEPNEIAHL